MLDMAADLPHAQALGANGRNRALECFSIERMSSEYAQLYARLAEEAS
jgi:glycosyltransferase involved in cell wall biosynthesis